jgi:ABC-type multidrug transport system fused ATPase/permease subunit
LSSNEIWGLFEGKTQAVIDFGGSLPYIALFLSLLIAVNYLDMNRFVHNKTVVAVISLISTGIDILFVSFSEYATLSAVQVRTQSYIQGIAVLLMGALPSCLGSVILSELTAETLKKRTERLLKEARDTSADMAKLAAQREKAMQDLKLFEKRKQEFRRDFERKEKTEDEK